MRHFSLWSLVWVHASSSHPFSSLFSCPRYPLSASVSLLAVSFTRIIFSFLFSPVFIKTHPSGFRSNVTSSRKPPHRPPQAELTCFLCFRLLGSHAPPLLGPGLASDLCVPLHNITLQRHICFSVLEFVLVWLCSGVSGDPPKRYGMF